jgi:hypothetical protein
VRGETVNITIISRTIFEKRMRNITSSAKRAPSSGHGMAAEAAMDKGRDREPWQKETTSVHLRAVASFRFPGTRTHEKA